MVHAVNYLGFGCVPCCLILCVVQPDRPEVLDGDQVKLDVSEKVSNLGIGISGHGFCSVELI